MKRFNVTGLCVPEEDYMVDISGKIAQIRKLIDDRCYFTINRARQYGKTTTLNALKNNLINEYMCIILSFEGVGKTMFTSVREFCQRFLWQIDMAVKHDYPHEKVVWLNENVSDFDELSVHLNELCKNKKIILMIDEVDKASNYEIFLYFLGMLRNKYHERKRKIGATFHSVILTGVYDIKNIKLKQVKAGALILKSEEGGETSPWNIAVDFEVNMSFSPNETATMLEEYEADQRTGMDIAIVSQEIYNYTSGYPFLVSRICQRIDEKLDKNWTLEGVQKAVKIILTENNTLFDDVFKNLDNDVDLYKFVYNILIVGEVKPFVIDDPVVNLGVRYGFFKNADDKVVISNRIFELRMVNYFISKDLRDKKQITGVLQYDIVKNGRFDMELCLRKFAEHYAEIYNTVDAAFIEREGRLLFLSYLKPLINGQGFYHIESQFTDARRMDIVVDYGREQFIIELKIWYGDKSHREGYNQLLGYMDSKRAAVGYLVTFDFRQVGNKERKCEWVEAEGKRILDVIV